MIRFLIFCVASFLSIHSYCQDWVRIYGQGLDVVGRYIIEDYDKGYLIIGDPDYKYSWVLKTDINGNELWTKTLGKGNCTVWSSNIEKTIDGGSIICGTWTKFNTSFDAFLIKLNACGGVEWCKTLITPTNYDMGIRVKPTPEGDFVLLGGYFLTDPYSNISLFKFNHSGDLIWHQFYPMDSIYYDDQPRDLVVDNDGYLIFSSRYCPDQGTNSPAIIRSYFLKTDTTGNKKWDLVYGVDSHYYSWPIMATKNSFNDYYATCSHTIYSSGDNPAIIKLLHNGDTSYNHDIINTGSFWLSGMISLDFFNDTNLILVGGWVINDVKDLVIIKTDTLGNLRKTKILPLLTSTYISTAKSFDNKFITIGNDATGATWKIYAVKVNSDLEYDSIYSQPFTYDSLCPYSIVSDTVDPDCDNVYVGIDEPFKNPETTRLKVYPNPATNFITIEMPKYLVVNNTASKIPSTTIYHMWGSAVLEIYDLFGKKLFEKEVIRSETALMIDVSRWPKGIYFCRLVFNNQTVADSKVIVE